jgi:8-oxo-dGTP pyrophosphatase MutT (NUDIX family)
MQHSESFPQKIKRILDQHEQQTWIANNNPLVPAAVLLPLFKKEGEYHLLLTKRTETLEYHKGQICFPGGSQHANDGDLKSTALRETFEEIGVCIEDVEILGELDRMSTISSNFLVTPFVGIIPYPYKFNVNKDEIDELVEVPLSALAGKANYREESYMINGIAHTGSIFEYQSKIIWGATARMIKQFLELISSTTNTKE